MDDTPRIAFSYKGVPTHFALVEEDADVPQRVEITRADMPIVRVPLADILAFAAKHHEASEEKPAEAG